MDSPTIGITRLVNQQIQGSAYTRAEALLHYMGAMQAQDLPMSKWAMGLRLQGNTRSDIESAMNAGEIIRIHVMRPTWHWVSAADIHWMMDLTRVHLQRQSRSWNTKLGLTPEILNRSFDILLAAISENGYAERADLTERLMASRIDPGDNRIAHILMEAEFEKLICSGPLLGNQQTYALFSERAGKNPGLSREESLASLAHRYFVSHGPATLADFIWWSGLPVADARAGLDSICNTLEQNTINGEIYYHSGKMLQDYPAKVFLLPAYDEYLISYKSRAHVLSEVHVNKAVSDNGIFRPLIVCGGQVKGLWKAVGKKGKREIETQFFNSPEEKCSGGLHAHLKELLNFLNAED